MIERKKMFGGAEIIGSDKIMTSSLHMNIHGAKF